MVIAEIAISLTLLVSAGLLLKSFWRLVHVAPGFQTDHVVTARLSLNQPAYGKYGDPQKRDGDIFIFNGMGQLVAHWMVHEGWPCRWEVPSLKAGSAEPAEEIVEIVHAGLSLEGRAGS